MDVLIAFSGTVEDDGIEYTEPKMNLTHSGEHIQENQLKEAFHSEDFNLLIVAEKYQTDLTNLYFIQCLSIRDYTE